MKRYLAILLVGVLVFVNLPVSVFAESCSHRWSMQYDPMYNYGYYDETYHLLENITLYYVCKNCGETKIEVQDGENYKSKHSFTGDTCYTCGYVREIAPTEPPKEEHKHDWELIYSPWYKYIYKDDTYHVLDRIELTYGCDCGESKAEVQLGNGELEKHRFVDNTCSVCEYYKIPDEPSKEPEVTEKPPESQPTVKPDDAENDTGEEEVHVCTFDKPYLVWIGAYTNCNNSTHTQQRVTFAYCRVCGEKHTFSNVPEKVAHTIVDGSCKWCKFKVYSTSSEIDFAIAQLNELKELSITLHSLKESKTISISQNTFDSINGKINSLIAEYEAVLRGEAFVDGAHVWRNDSDLKLIWSIKEGDYEGHKLKLPNVDSIDVTKYVGYTYINLEEPDNKWYYLVNDVGEQVIFGNFTEKVTITGVGAQILVGEIPFVGTAADLRDVIADFANWEWSWGHVGVTALDAIGLIPIVGALKYSDELNVAVKGVQLSDEAGEVLSEAVKHADEISDATKNSDELGEVVEEALTKHVDEVGEATGAVVKKFDDLLKVVEHPEYFKDGALEHIFKGNSSGGFHYEGLSDANGKVVSVTKPADANGVYEAVVEINGKTKARPSTFFPKEWTPKQVADAIEEAYTKKSYVRGNTYRATISSGITIEMYIEKSTGKIISAFPVMN